MPLNRQDRDRAFIDALFANGHNATKAYQAVYGCSDATAQRKGKQKSQKVLNSQYYLDRQAEYQKNCGESFESLMAEVRELRDQAKAAGDRQLWHQTIRTRIEMLGYKAETRIKLSGDKDQPIQLALPQWMTGDAG